MNKCKKTVYIILRTLKNCKNDRYLDKVYNVEKNATSFMLGENKIKENKEIVYLIDIDTYKAGFCAILRNLLSAMYIADSFNWVPYVNINKSIYSVPDGFNGKKNMFEYFFKNMLKCDDVNEIKKNFNCFEYELPHRELLDNTFLSKRTLVAGYEITDEYIDVLAGLRRKYLIFNDEIQNKLDKEVSVLLKGRKIVGVHVRGTDFKDGEKGHPTYVRCDQYISKLKEMLKLNYDMIFLATDEAGVVDRFEKEFPNKLVYYLDVFRSSNGEAVHMQKNTRDNNEYFLGWEILRDMYTLSKCDALIAGISQVSIMARVYKKSRQESYSDLVIISNGINK